jgi:hypothetical protein
MVTSGSGGKPFALAESGHAAYLASKTGRFLPTDVRDAGVIRG